MPTFIRALAATLLTFSLATTPTVFAADPTAKAEWLELFNGKDLNDWTVKITGSRWDKTSTRPFVFLTVFLRSATTNTLPLIINLGIFFTTSLLPITNCLWSTALSANNYGRPWLGKAQQWGHAARSGTCQHERGPRFSRFCRSTIFRRP